MKRMLFRHLFPQASPTPLTMHAFSKLSERYRLSDFLTYRTFQENCILLADNPSGADSILIGFQLFPLIMAGEKIQHKVEFILNRLPIGASLHSIVHASEDIRAYLEEWLLSRQGAHHPIFDMITQRRIKQWIAWSEGKKSLLHAPHFAPRILHYYWFIRIPSEQKTGDKHGLQQALLSVQQLADTVVSELQAGHLHVRALGGQEMARCIKRLLCPNKQWREKWGDPNESTLTKQVPLSEQLLNVSTRITVSNTGDLCFHSCPNTKDKLPSHTGYVRAFSNVQLPQSPFYMHTLSHCIGNTQYTSENIPGEFYVYTVFHRLCAEKIQFRAGKKMATLQYQTASNSEFWQQIMRPLYKRKQHVQELYNALDKKGKQPVKVWSGIILKSNSLHALEESTGICQSLWKSIGMELHRETCISVPVWLATLPGQYRGEIDGSDYGLQRGLTITSDQAATLAHIQGDWLGSHPSQGGILGMSRRGALTTINLFNTFKSNYNAVMAASSGSGKSFMINEMVVDFLARGGKVRIIDAGRSYFHTAQMLKGENIVFDPCTTAGKRLCINPFSHIATQTDLHEDMDTLVTLIAQMAFPFGFGQHVTTTAHTHETHASDKPYEYRAIEASIETVWAKKGHHMSVRDIADYFQHQKETSLKKISAQLRPWAYGRYADWLVGSANLCFDNPFVVLELDELSDEPELQGIVLNLILAKIAREMYLSAQQEQKQLGRRLPKLIVIDEAWDLLRRPHTGAFIEKAYRRARKYYCAMIIVTQSFTDCERTSAAKTALSNANWIFSLVHDMGALEKASHQHLINFSAYTKERIASLQKTEAYSEFYVINKSVKGEGLYRLVVDPATYWMYTTDATERNKLAQCMARGLSIEQAIIQLSKQRDTLYVDNHPTPLPS